MSRTFLGVDAGNSKTLALLGEETGRVIGWGRAGNGDVYGASTAEDAIQAVVAAVSAALAGAGVGSAEVRHAAFRLAGVDWAEDYDFWRQVVTEHWPGLSASVSNDGYALLRCGSRSGRGVAVTVGTGPAVAARGPSGAGYSASWWILERIGGQDLGAAALAAVVAAELGLGPPTSLRERLLSLYREPDVEALLHTFTRRVGGRGRQQLRLAARVVLEAGEQADAVARSLVATQARALAGHAAVAARRVGFDSTGNVPVVLGGSLLMSEHGPYAAAVTDEIRRVLPQADVARAAGPPVAGALLDALAEAGQPLSGGVRQRVLNALHPAGFLVTE